MDKELLSKCRYYKGEEKYPSSLKGNRAFLYWHAEAIWVSKKGKADHSSIMFMVNCGLSDEAILLARKPKEFVNIPLDLRAIMFEYLCHNNYSDPMHVAKFFLNTVLPEYLA